MKMLNSAMRDGYKPPMDTQKFTEWLQWALAEFDDVKLETWAIDDIDRERGYSADDKIAENIYRFCNGGARFQITVTQLSTEDEVDNYA